MKIEPLTVAEELEEIQRQTSIRCFEVLVTGAEPVRVFAHYHDCTYGPGHLCFITIEPGRVHRISSMYNVNVPWVVREILDDSTNLAFLRTAQLRAEQTAKQTEEAKIAAIPPGTPVATKTPKGIM